MDKDSGRAIIVKKNHFFKVGGISYVCFKIMLEARIKNENNGEALCKDFFQATKLKKWEDVKKRVRQLRRNLGINRKLNPQDDVFLDTGTGYKLIEPQYN